MNIVTGEDLGWRYYVVTAVDPVSFARLTCRRVTFATEDGGWEGRCHVQDFLAQYQAVDNIVSMRK